MIGSDIDELLYKYLSFNNEKTTNHHDQKAFYKTQKWWKIKCCPNKNNSPTSFARNLIVNLSYLSVVYCFHYPF